MKSLLATLAAGLTAVLTAVPSPSPAAHVQTEQAPASSEMLLAGDWRGPTGNKHITFRFQYANGSWLGFFVSELNGNLYPVEDMQVSDRSVSFRLKSTPEITFDLRLEDDNRTLSGTGTHPDGIAFSYSLTRKDVS